MDYHNKYIKYKQKYLKLKNHHGGKLPFVELDDENKIKDYFPFDNDKFNYYNDNYSLIVNDSFKDYSLNKRFELVKLDSKFDKTVYNEKNIINDNNIYKLADEQITISDEIKIPFHLCLLSKYKILDELYQKHINIIIDTKQTNYKYININKKEKYKIQIKLKSEDIDQNLFKLQENEIFLKNNAKKVFTNIFNLHSETNRILDITYNYNILLKYSYCNKFLELLKLIYDIQSKIDYKNLDIMSTNIEEKKNVFKYIKILFNNDEYNLEDYITINIINFFISPASNLKNNFKNIYDCYKQKLEDNDYKNAIQTYINISDTTLLFKYITDSNVNLQKGKTNVILKEDVKNTIGKKNLDSDLKSLKEHLEDDIKDIKQLLLFNLYVDNEIDISPKFSYIFYALFIYYRINKPLISYPLFSNLYPINKNNFICNLIGIESEYLYLLINKSDNELSINKKMFYSNYIKHSILHLGGFVIKTEKYSYTNCVENSILEFIKILFWDQTQFEIKLPEENIETETETLKLLRDIFNDINKNLNNITSFYESNEYNKKIDHLFSGHNNIYYRNNDKTKSLLYPLYTYEMDSTMNNVYNMLCIILNFKTEEELKKYLGEINNYNTDITKIDITDKDGIIDIYINEYKLYTINIETGHAYLESFEKIGIFELIEYDYFNLLIYNTNIISNYNIQICEEYIIKYENLLSKYEKDHKNYKNLKFYEYIVILIIIKYPKLTNYINYDFPNYMEIIYTAFEKNPDILCHTYFISDKEIEIIYNKILNTIQLDHPKYKDKVKCILWRKPHFIKDIPKNHKDFSEIIINSMNVDGYTNCDIINYIVNYDYDYINTLLNTIQQNHPKYKDIVKCFLRVNPKLIKNIPIDHPDFSEIVINTVYVSGKYNYEIVDYLVKNHYSYINTLLNTNKQNHLQYKYLVICILSVSPEFIKNIHIDHPDFLEIVINSIKVDDNINYYIIDYLIKNHPDYINILLNKIILDYSKHKELVKYILSTSPNFIKNIPINHPNYSKIVNVKNNKICVCM